MRLLNKTAETKLISAIENAAALVNNGMAPNDAIVKSATDAGIPPGHLDLMVHAYNTGRTTKQRESGENTLEKAADFTLADITEIKNRLYGATPSTTAQIKTSSVVSPEYALNPAAMIKRATSTPKIVPPMQLTFTPPPRDEHSAARRSYSEKRAAQLREEEQRRQVTAAYQKAAAKFDELVTYFRTPGHVPYPDVLKDVELTHGEHGVLVMKKLAGMYPELEKEASANQRIMLDKKAREVVHDVLDLVEQYNDLAAEHYKTAATKLAAAKKTEHPETYTGSILSALSDAPVVLKKAANPLIESFYNDEGREYKAQWNPTTNAWDQIGGLRALPPEKPEKPEKPDYNLGVGDAVRAALPNAGTMLTAPAATIGKMMGIGGDSGKPTGNAPPGAGAYNSVADPEHEMALKSIRAKGVLHDLILNDPVVSGYDPQDVAMAFNDISELAPNLVDTPGMLQTVLRKRLESGQLADFDVKQILEMDKLRAERDKIQGEARRINMESM